MASDAIIGNKIDKQEGNRPDDRRARSEHETQWNEHSA
jgi:hypothetical protein